MGGGVCMCVRIEYLFPLEGVLVDVGGGRGVPLDGVGVRLVARLCDDHLHRAMATWGNE